MRVRGLTFPVQLIIAGFRRNRAPNLPIVSGIIVISVAEALLIAAGAYVDDTWRLPGDAKGLLVHYGAWATIVTDPLLMLAAAYAYRQFRFALSTLPVASKEDAAKIRRIARPHLEFLALKRNGAFVYAALVFVGALSWLNNIRQTVDPTVYFGHDVYDSIRHTYGFIAHKFMLFTSWVIVYPVAGFFIVSLSLSTRVVLGALRKRDLILHSVTHPDGCYGLAELGKLNICLLFPYLLAFTVIFAVIITHQRAYLSAEIPLIVLTILFLGASVATIKPTLAHARSIKRGLYERLSSKSSTFGRFGEAADFVFGVERICFGMASGSPYSKSGKSILLAMRLTPVILTAIKVYNDHLR